MEKSKRYKRLANLADIVRATSFGVAAYNDYGFWQYIWGIESAMGAYELAGGVRPQMSVFGLKLPGLTQALAGLGSFAIAAGSFFTGDPKNALVYGSAGVGFLGNYAKNYFKQKAAEVSSELEKIKDKKLKKIIIKVADCKAESDYLATEFHRLSFGKKKINFIDKWKFNKIKKEADKLENIVEDLSEKYPNYMVQLRKHTDLVLKRVNWVKQQLEKYNLKENIALKAIKETGYYANKGAGILLNTLNVAILSLASYFVAESWDVYKDYFQDKTKYANTQVTKDDVILKFINKSQELEMAYIEGNDLQIEKITKEMNSIKGEVENKLENLVECDLSLLMKEKVNISAGFDRSKCVLLISKKYELGILNFYGFDIPIPGVQVNPYMYRRLTDFEKIALQDLGESMGLDAKRLPIESKEFKELTALIRVNHYLGEEELKERIKNKTNEIAMSLGLTLEQIEENRKNYSVYVGQIGGLTLDSPLFQLININDVQSSLKDLIFVYGHETGHAYFMKNSNLFECFNPMIGAFFNTDRTIIEETAADTVGALCMQEFAKNHLKEDKALYDRYMKEMSIPRANEGRYEAVETFEKYVKEEEYEKLENYLNTTEDNLKVKTGRPYVPINSASITIMKTYSGKRDVSEKIAYLANKLGLKEFTKTIAGISSFRDLDEIYQKLKD